MMILKSSGQQLAGYAGRQAQKVSQLGNKCGKCQNHEIEVWKKGHARDCPFKKCNCLRCRLLDARSDILQVISGKETKLKGTKKDPNCGFCQNHGVKILRKGHVRSCGFGQERHFKLDNCFDCEVHYIRNEVNRLQIKMRRAMKEDRTLSEEQKKTAREAITREEVEKVCELARLARKKRESILARQALLGESSSQSGSNQRHSAASHGSDEPSSGLSTGNGPVRLGAGGRNQRGQAEARVACPLTKRARQAGVWRPWSQHQVAAAMVAAQQHQPHPLQLQLHDQHQHHLLHQHHLHQHHQQQQQQQLQQLQLQHQHQHQQLDQQQQTRLAASLQHFRAPKHLMNQNHPQPAAPAYQLLQPPIPHESQPQHSLLPLAPEAHTGSLVAARMAAARLPNAALMMANISPPSSPPESLAGSPVEQPVPLIQRNLHGQQLISTLISIVLARVAQTAAANANH